MGRRALPARDTDIITDATGAAARARGVTEVAEHAGLSRESLYKALSGEGNPQFATIIRVLAALGLRLRAEPAGTGKRAA
jgi:probable addiction module antidote protein